MGEEPTYTLPEAEREIARRMCATHGHDWSIVSNVAGAAMSICCERCGWGGSVTMHERPR